MLMFGDEFYMNTMGLFDSILLYLENEVGPIFVRLVLAPLEYPDMLWVSIPLVVSTLAMAFYFGTYVKEKLGWNTAFGNSLVLFFVAIDLMREVLSAPRVLSFIAGILSPNFFLALMVGAFAVVLATVDFLHKLPEQIAFFISAPLVLNLIAYVSMAIVYAGLPFTGATLISGLLLFLSFSVIIGVFKYFLRVLFTT